MAAQRLGNDTGRVSCPCKVWCPYGVSAHKLFIYFNFFNVKYVMTRFFSGLNEIIQQFHPLNQHTFCMFPCPVWSSTAMSAHENKFQTLLVISCVKVKINHRRASALLHTNSKSWIRSVRHSFWLLAESFVVVLSQM